MINRYQNDLIADIFSDLTKLRLWQDTEMAVIEARYGHNSEAYDHIRRAWFEDFSLNEESLKFWKTRDKEIHHDLNAFLDERLRHLEAKWHHFVHEKITSYDTEEPAFHTMLQSALRVVDNHYKQLEEVIENAAKKYRYLLMNARTHGQEAELQTMGARFLTNLVDLRVAREALSESRDRLKYCKLSGAIGKYGSLDPEMEKQALMTLGYTPFYGSTQIMPRIIHAPIAQGLGNLVAVVNKIALDIRLNSRSGRPLMQEPFGKKQKGSSAMPQKKNTIRTEQIEGLARMARSYSHMIEENIVTWEERAIEQSSVERVAWPDLFHTVCQALKVLTEVIESMPVYPDHILQEIHESRGVYAASEAKEWLKSNLGKFEAKHEDAYRIVQLACFNVFEPSLEQEVLRLRLPKNFQEATNNLNDKEFLPKKKVESIQEFIPKGKLRVSSSLDLSKEQVAEYNTWLQKLFADENLVPSWNELFEPAFLLKQQDFLYQQILGE